MKKLDSFLDKVLSVITVILYMAMIIVVLMQIAARYMPSLTLSWTEELTRFIFVFIIALGAPLSLKYNAFADVDLIYEKFPKNAKKICIFIDFLLISIFLGIVIYSGYLFTTLGGRSVSPAMRWPMFIHHSTILFFGIFSLFYSVLKLIDFLKDSDKALEQFDITQD